VKEKSVEERWRMEVGGREWRGEWEREEDSGVEGRRVEGTRR